MTRRRDCGVTDERDDPLFPLPELEDIDDLAWALIVVLVGAALVLGVLLLAVVS